MKRSVTSRAAIIGGIFVVIAALITVLPQFCRPSVPTINAGRDNIGRDKINTSGGDYVAGDKIVKQEVSDYNEIALKIAEHLKPQLTKQYPEGYIVFGVSPKGYVVLKGLVPPGCEIQWDSARILSISDEYIELLLPDIEYQNVYLHGNKTKILKEINATDNPFGFIGFCVQLEVIGIDKELVVVAMGFIPKKEGNCP